MKRFFTLLVSSIFVLVVFSNSSSASTLINNVALSSLGAQAFDNGHWVEGSSYNTGFHYEAKLVIDDSKDSNGVPGASFWAGIGSYRPQQVWVLFDQRYTIDAIYLDEVSIAFLTSGILEYLKDGSWMPLNSISKNSANYFTSFSPVQADGVRLSVYSAAVPFSWSNKATCLYSFEARAVAPVPLPGALLLFTPGFIGLIGWRSRLWNNIRMKS